MHRHGALFTIALSLFRLSFPDDNKMKTLKSKAVLCPGSDSVKEAIDGRGSEVSFHCLLFLLSLFFIVSCALLLGIRCSFPS